MIELLGDLPLEWVPKWKQMRLDAEGDSALRGNKLASGLTLEQRFDANINDPQLKALLPVIKGLTMLLPSDRISASEALELIRASSTD